MEIQIPSKKFGGFDIKIFSNPINPDFICTICNNVVRQPKECTVCGTLNNGKKEIEIIHVNVL